VDNSFLRSVVLAGACFSALANSADIALAVVGAAKTGAGDSVPNPSHLGGQKVSEAEEAHLLSVPALAKLRTVDNWFNKFPADEQGRRRLKGCEISQSQGGVWLIKNSSGDAVVLSSAKEVAVGMDKDSKEVLMSGAAVSAPAYDIGEGMTLGSAEGANLRFDPNGNLIEVEFYARETRIPRPGVDNPNPRDEGSSNKITCK